MSIEIRISKKRIPYKTAMLYLNKRVEEVKNGSNRELLWILEHPTTFTAGVSFNKKEIIDKKIKVIKSNRGGKITLHNPGQKIVYFVINLNERKKDIRKLISSIENSIIQFLENCKFNFDMGQQALQQCCGKPEDLDISEKIGNPFHNQKTF